VGSGGGGIVIVVVLVDDDDTCGLMMVACLPGIPKPQGIGLIMNGWSGGTEKSLTWRCEEER
jgi:hypothetical protein